MTLWKGGLKAVLPALWHCVDEATSMLRRAEGGIEEDGKEGFSEVKAHDCDVTVVADYRK